MYHFTRVRRALVVGLAAVAATLSMTQVANAEPAGPNLPPDVAAKIGVPAGNKVFLVGHATGVQSYKCNATTSTWETASTPDAKLVDDKGKLVATHFGGPTWQARDGSTVVGSLPPKASAPSPDGSIAWLLLTAKSTAPGPDGGQFVNTTFIQRVKTTGGVGPVGSCTAAQTPVMNVPYTADYYFWKATGPGAR